MEKNQISEIPEKEGYVAIEKDVGGGWIKFVGLIIIVLVLAITINVHAFVWGECIVSIFEAVLMVVLILMWPFIYDLSHGIAWCLLSNLPLNRICFGMLKPRSDGFKSYIDGELLTKKNYVRGMLIPDIILGAVPLILGLCINCWSATLFGSFMLVCALLDTGIILLTVHGESDDTMVYVHPKKIGVYVYHKAV